MCDPLDPFLDSIDDVRDDLDGFAKVVPPPLLLNDLVVYLALKRNREVSKGEEREKREKCE